MPRTLGRLFALGCALMPLGCSRSEPENYVSSAKVRDLTSEQQTTIVALLEKHCGTPQAPRLLGERSRSERTTNAQLQRGRDLYARHCQACHGTSGDGAGPAAEYLTPRPRDYRLGLFKFKSTLNRPTRDDLRHFVRRGATGTAMPAFKLWPDEDIEAVLDYVQALTWRGEFEGYLVNAVDNDEDLTDEFVAEMTARIMAPWKAADQQVLHPVWAKKPAYNAASIALGRDLFLGAREGVGSCVKCHGADGRGRTQDNVGKDSWGATVKAADLTTGMFHGGDRAEDIYLRIYGGIGGTPMPSHSNLFLGKEDQLWHVVHYVQFLADTNRRTVAQAAEQRQAKLRPAPSTKEGQGE